MKSHSGVAWTKPTAFFSSAKPSLKSECRHNFRMTQTGLGFRTTKRLQKNGKFGASANTNGCHVLICHHHPQMQSSMALPPMQQCLRVNLQRCYSLLGLEIVQWALGEQVNFPSRSRPSYRAPHRRQTDEGRKQHEFPQEGQRLQQRNKLTHLRSLAYGLLSDLRRQLERRICRRSILCRMCMRHFPVKAILVQNVMLSTLLETLRKFVADTLGETPQEHHLRPRSTVTHLTKRIQGEKSPNQHT